MFEFFLSPHFPFVIPAKAGIQNKKVFCSAFIKSPLTPLLQRGGFLDSPFQGNDNRKIFAKKTIPTT
jgi:hypothetical protein